MTFAAATLVLAGSAGGGGGGSISSVTTGVGSSTGRLGDYQWWGWLQTPAFSSIWGPDSAIGSSSPTVPSWRGSTIVGIYAGDAATGTASASNYTVVLTGVCASGTVNTLTIDSTAIGANSLAVITGYQPYYTLFRFNLTTPGTNLFGTSGTHTVTLT
jgi:hypothetical protein